MSIGEERAHNIVQSGIRKLDIGYEVALPWKEGEPQFRCNRVMAENRLANLTRRFQRDKEFERCYQKAVLKYQEEGYARKILDKADAARTDQYFLPHHGVLKKSTDSSEKKLRVVFDSATSLNGKCLNDALLTGPVLQTQLPKILVKFREGQVALTADIEAMFSRIRLTPEDARFHRFLWKEPGSDEIEVLQMDILAFGDKCSPFIAISVVQRVAEEFGKDRTEASNAIRHNLYVDDYLDSTSTTEEAMRRAKDVREIPGDAAGDFNLRNWMSNSQVFLNALEPRETCAGAEEIELAGPDQAAILGVCWRPKTDVLSFSIFQPSDVTFTRRGLLSKLASVFDPLGLASPVTVQAKIKLKLLSLGGLHWDSEVPEIERRWWENWLHHLPSLNAVRIPRCLHSSTDAPISLQLHTFTDASEEAFAAAVYLRSEYPGGRVTTRLLMAKTKLAPKKTLSVVKLELQAALLGSRLASYVGDALTRPISARYFWTDNSSVRNWLRSDSSLYKVFVSHRIGEIQSSTSPEEWRYVPGSQNSSDLATRSSFIGEEIPAEWFEGPAFLSRPEEKWPKDLPWMTPAEELRSKETLQVHHLQGKRGCQEIDWDGFNFDPANLPSYPDCRGPFLN